MNFFRRYFMKKPEKENRWNTMGLIGRHPNRIRIMRWASPAKLHNMERGARFPHKTPIVSTTGTTSVYITIPLPGCHQLHLHNVSIWNPRIDERTMPEVIATIIESIPRSRGWR